MQITPSATPITMTPTSAPLPPTPAPQPPGPAPEGKVWSAEHGHWHDAPGATPGVTLMPAPMQAAPTEGAPAVTLMPMAPPAAPGSPQPAGPAPPGKEWSVDHGHWHDAPGAGSALTPMPAPLQVMPSGGGPAVTLTPSNPPSPGTPQPDGPVPPGKVWSPEHGHWHDAPTVPTPVVTPPPAAPAPKDLPQP